jgi:phage terminase large subunit-like protein
MNEGSLIIMPGAILNLLDVYDDISKYIEECNYTVMCFGYDPWNAKEFVERWSSENGAYGVIKVIQGAKTESVPLGQLKTLAEQKLLCFDQSITQFAMGNCMVKEDVNGMRMLGKKRGQDKIDPFAATLDAFVAYKQHADDFAL